MSILRKLRQVDAILALPDFEKDSAKIKTKSEYAIISDDDESDQKVQKNKTSP